MEKTRFDIAAVEERFKEVTGIEADLTEFPIPESRSAQQKTSKDDAEKYGFVTTPLHIVDKMVMDTVDKLGKPLSEHGFIDLCCGCGQFSVRLLRRIKMLDVDSLDEEFVMGNLLMTDINPESIAKAIYVFNGKLTLMMGDSSFLKNKESYRGLLFWSDGRKEWVSDKEFNDSVASVLSSGKPWKEQVGAIEQEVRKKMDEDGTYHPKRIEQLTFDFF